MSTLATPATATAPAPAPVQGTAAPAAGLLRHAGFRWLLAGSLVSTLGDQFTLIALPWLVLQLSGDPLALGLVLAVMSVPRAILILVGGALVDRHSPRTVLLVSKLAQVLHLDASVELEPLDTGLTPLTLAPTNVALASLVGILVTLQAYVWPFTLMVVR